MPSRTFCNFIIVEQFIKWDTPDNWSCYPKCESLFPFSLFILGNQLFTQLILNYQDIWRFRRELLEWWQRSRPLTFNSEYLKINSRFPDPQIRAVSIMIHWDFGLYMWGIHLFQSGQHGDFWAFIVTLKSRQWIWHKDPWGTSSDLEVVCLVKDLCMVKSRHLDLLPSLLRLCLCVCCSLYLECTSTGYVLSLCFTYFLEKPFLTYLFNKCGTSSILSLLTPIF